MKTSLYGKALLALVVGVALITLFAAGSTAVRAQNGPNDLSAKLDRLELDIQRASSLREVKQLQHLYSLYGEYGLWDEIAGLFSVNGEALFGDQVVRGREAIRRHLTTVVGKGRNGLPVGSLNTQILQAPVVTLSVDGSQARSRWQVLELHGEFGKSADWYGGMQENEFIKEDGRWKIARLGYHEQFAGSYETGWLTTKPRNSFIPYHYTPAQAGKPVPDLPDAAMNRAAKNPAQTTAQLQRVDQQIRMLNEEDEVRNLQNIYGYYVDRKMWDDVVDLFTADSAYEVAGIGVYKGPAGVRKAMEREGGPINLQTGQVHDHLQLSTIVTVSPNGLEAQARGLQLGMLTPKLGEAYWSVSTFQNRYVKRNGAWQILEMRIFPKMKTDYYQGPAKSSVVEPAPAAQFRPDAPSTSDAPQVVAVVPVFESPNPATGKPVMYPSGLRPVGTARLVNPPAATVSMPDAPALSAEWLTDAQRRLARSKAYDAIDNISSTFGYYLDDFQWQNYVETYAVSGRRKKGSGGFYIGRNRIFLVEALGYGHMPPDRDGLRVHTRLQPVIHVSQDAQSAYIRTRMFLYFANPRTPGAFNSGMYPNDSALLEDGIWKFNVGGSIDETYFSSNGYKNGWAKPNPAGRGGGAAGDDAPAAGEAAAGPQGGRGGRGGGPALANTRLGGRAPVGARTDIEVAMPPDVSYADMPYRGQGFVRTFPNFRGWPEIKPMWFHYKNPISGRTPEFYCPDILTCDAEMRKR